MFEGRYIFSQLMDFIPWRRMQTCVNRYDGDHRIITYNCAEQFRVMAFAQLTYRHSLREVEAFFSTLPWVYIGLRITLLGATPVASVQQDQEIDIHE